MKLVRLGISVVLGVAVTFGLLVLMYTLIASDSEFKQKEETAALADIWQADRVIDDNLRKYNVKKPEPKNPPPPRMAQEQAKAEDVTMAVQMEAPRMDAALAMSSGGFGGNAGGRPLKRVPPKYPQRALERELEGYCTVEFTVTKEGAVFNPVVIEAMVVKKNGEKTPTTIFNSAAVRAARKMKFKPQMEDNQPVEYITTYKFVFEISDDK